MDGKVQEGQSVLTCVRQEPSSSNCSVPGGGQEVDNGAEAEAKESVPITPDTKEMNEE